LQGNSRLKEVRNLKKQGSPSGRRAYNSNAFSTEDTPKGINETYETSIVFSSQGEPVAVEEAFLIYYNLDQGTILSVEPTDFNDTFSKPDTLIDPKPLISNPPKPPTINLFIGGSFTK